MSDIPRFFELSGMSDGAERETSRSASRRAVMSGLLVGVGLLGRQSAQATIPDARADTSLQSRLDGLGRRGGGTLRLGSDARAGVLHISGADITIDGQGHTLLDTRIVIAADAERIVIRNLTLLETTGNPESYLIDISGRECRLENIRLEKRPMAGGYQGYLRHSSRKCTFDALTLMGSNGLFVAGEDHVFDGFDFTSTLRRDLGGDDAFAIKAAGSTTRNITIRNGKVKGFSAAISIGSEVGSNDEARAPGVVSNIVVEDVMADRCQMLAFIKPGALIYDWRNGVVENVTLSRIKLMDRDGFSFARGIAISAARGAVVRGITARDITIEGRTHAAGVMPTAAVDITIRDEGAPAVIEDVDLSVTFDGAGKAGYAVDHIVRIEKENPNIGAMRGIVIDVAGSHSRISGVYIGAGLDDAVVLRRVRLDHVGEAPPSSIGAAAIWADSRFKGGDLRIESVRVPARGGRGFSEARR